MTPEEHADNIARWTNAGLRQAVIDEIARAVADEHAATKEQAAQVCDDKEREAHEKSVHGRAVEHEYRIIQRDAAQRLAASIRALP